MLMLKEKVLKTIKRYDLIKSGDSLVVGVSGGPDSICLLNILMEIRKDSSIDLTYDIHVCHMNHMLRKEASKEQEYVFEFCKKNQIPCYIKKENVLEISKNQKIGTEEAGRNVRYEFFEQVLNLTNSNKIVTAHNLNDKVETVLMNIIRGSGIYGLKGIEAKRSEKFVRPLIECKREEIEGYCNINHLNPQYDKSNKENIYTRNKIRNELIPYLKKEFNPSLEDAIYNLSELASDDILYLEYIVKEEFERLLISKNEKEIIINLGKFNLLELVIKRRVILYTIREIKGSTKGIEKIHIEDIIKLCQNNIGNKYLTPNKNIKVLVRKGEIYFSVVG